MSHKNDYSCIVYFGKDEKPKKWNYVHTLNSFESFLNAKHPTWTYFNVYERRTRKYLKRFYKGSVIPYFLPLLLLAFASIPLFFLTFNKPSFSYSHTFINGFNNTATIWTLSKPKGGVL